MESSRVLIAAACALSLSALAIVAPRDSRRVSLAHPGPEAVQQHPARSTRVPVLVVEARADEPQARNETAPDADLEEGAGR